MSPSGYLDPRPRIFHQSHLLHDLARPFVTTRRRSRAHQASHQLPKLEMTGWFPSVAARGAASSEGKEVGAITVIQSSSPQGCTPSPALLGTEKTPQSAWRWRRWWRPGDTSWKSAAPGHSWEGAAAAAASAAALAQPQDIYVPPQPGSRPAPFYFFPLRKHPQKGNERLQPFLSADSCRQLRKVFRNDLGFIGPYCLERSIIYQVRVSFSSSRTNQGRLQCWKQLKGQWGKGCSAWAPPCIAAVFQLAWIPQEAVSRGTVLRLYHYLNPSEFFPGLVPYQECVTSHRAVVCGISQHSWSVGSVAARVCPQSHVRGHPSFCWDHAVLEGAAAWQAATLWPTQVLSR